MPGLPEGWCISQGLTMSSLGFPGVFSDKTIRFAEWGKDINLTGSDFQVHH